MANEVKIEGVKEIIDTLNKLALQDANMTPIMTQIGQFIVNETQMSFEGQRSPFGGAWAPTKSKVSGKQILIDSGVLYGSFTVEAGDKEVSVGTNVIYAAIHQFGGNAGRGKKVHIPARPFMPIDAGGNLPKGLEEMIMDYLGDQLMKE